MVRTRTASRSRRAPARARGVPAGRPRTRPSVSPSAGRQSSVGRSARSPPRVASRAHRGRGSDARGRAGAMARDRARIARGRRGWRRARAFRPAGCRFVVVGWWFGRVVGWVVGLDLPDCRVGPPQRNRRARASAKKIFSGNHFAFARASPLHDARSARARARAFLCLFPALPFPVFPRFGRDGGLGLHPKTQSNRTDAPRQTTKAQRERHRKSFRGTGAHPLFAPPHPSIGGARTHSHPGDEKNSLPKAFCDVSGMRWRKHTPKKSA